MYLLSLFVFMVFVVGFMAITGGGGFLALSYFIDMPSIILLILLLVPMLLNAGVLKDLNNALRLGARRSIQAERLELIRAVEAVTFTIKALWTVGIFSVIFQFSIAIMGNAPDAKMAFLYTAVSIIPLWYTTFFVILLLPLRSRLNMKLKTLCEESVFNAAVSNAAVSNAAVNNAAVSNAAVNDASANNAVINTDVVKTDSICAVNDRMQAIEQKHEFGSKKAE